LRPPAFVIGAVRMGSTRLIDNLIVLRQAQPFDTAQDDDSDV
jgi:hypothetical protein